MVDEAHLIDTVNLALHTVLVLAGLLLVALIGSGMLVALLQAVTTVRDEAVLFSVRVIALFVTLYLTFPLFSSLLVKLTVQAFS